jgi:hypothetical protein
LLATACGGAERPIVLNLNGQAIQAETVATPETRARGLMFRPSLPENAGMLFVFPRAERQCMWMQDTLIPLSVAFLDAAGRILNVAEMAPGSRALHCSSAPSRYALEMNAGWFGRHGGQTGMPVSGLNRAPEPD